MLPSLVFLLPSVLLAHHALVAQLIRIHPPALLNLILSDPSLSCSCDLLFLSFLFFCQAPFIGSLWKDCSPPFFPLCPLSVELVNIYGVKVIPISVV